MCSKRQGFDRNIGNAARRLYFRSNEVDHVQINRCLLIIHRVSSTAWRIQARTDSNVRRYRGLLPEYSLMSAAPSLSHLHKHRSLWFDRCPRANAS